jgi:hypothetical protein
VGWLDNPVGLHSLTGTIHVVEAAAHAVLGGDRSPVTLARKLGCQFVEKAAQRCPVILIDDPARFVELGLRVLSIEWWSATNAGEIVDARTERRFYGDLQDCRIAAMPKSEAQKAIEFLTAKWDITQNEQGDLVRRLMNGMTGEELIDNELDELFCPSIDRVIRHVTSGAVDEDAVELALFLGQMRRGSTWLNRTLFRSRHPMVEWNRHLAEECASSVPLTWEPTHSGNSPWGKIIRIQLPEVCMRDGTQLPPEERLLFEYPPDPLVMA